MELWFQDEARVGQIGRTGRVWYDRGVRPRGLRDMRHAAAWIFGAICPERDTGVALVLPEATVPAMQALIDELESQLPADRQAVLVTDRAGWHIAAKLTWPETITPLHLPSYSPELNALLSQVEGPIERVWLYLRERFPQPPPVRHRRRHRRCMLRRLERPPGRNWTRGKPRSLRLSMTGQSFEETV